jgi:RHS repeat-associated protein
MGATATVERSTYSAAGQAVAVRVSGDPNNSGLFYMHKDHLGSATFLTQTNGQVKSGTTARYLPFGDYRATPTSDITDVGFTGHKHNDYIKLIYMNARYYVGAIGRFASADTVVPNPGNPQTYNRYSYTLNNPTKYVDPIGHCVLGLPCPEFIEDAADSVIETYNNVASSVIDLYQQTLNLGGKLLDVDIAGAVNTENLEGNWLQFYFVWFFETSPDDLGEWGDLDGTPVVTITSEDFVNDLKSKPNYEETSQLLRDACPIADSSCIGTSIENHFIFTGPGTTTGNYDPVEWYLGSYKTEMTITGVDLEANQLIVDVTVTNLSHWQSGTRVPQSFQDQGFSPYLIPNVSRDAMGMGGNYYQRFIWEDIIN